jgi:hypothetical protein
VSRIVAGVLLCAAAAGALARAASSSPTARLGAGALIVVLGLVIAGVFRGRRWALGSAFFLGLFTLWAAVALGLRHDLSASGTAFGIAWALTVMAASVKANARQGLHA